MSDDILTSEQVRAARALLHWSQGDLAERSNVAVSTVADFERGHRVPVANNVLAIRRTLENAWLLFVDGGVVPGFRWTFVTESAMSTLSVTFHPKDAPVIQELASLFADVTETGVALGMVQCATPELKTKLADFVNRHGNMAPHLNRMKKAVCDLPDGSFFLLLTVPPSSSEDEFHYQRAVFQLNHPEEEIEESEHERIFGRLLREYDLTIPRTDKRNEIGNPRKQDRRCRFCNRTLADNAKFEKVAHAIPACMGNKLLKLNDECDDCNQHFGDNVEPTLAELLRIHRVFLGIEGRGMKRAAKFSNGSMFHDGKQLVVVSDKISKDAAGALNAQLGGEKRVVPMKFYQALAKIALSVIPEEELSLLKRTAAWVRFDEFAGTKLPEVASAVVPLPPDPSAQIALYIRRSEASRLPHVVCEFRLGCYLYVYSLPFSDKDNWDLVGFFGDETFVDTFRHYSHVKSWSIEDYSSATEVPIVQSINVAPRNPAPR